MAANWQGQAAQAQYPYQPATGYQQPQAGYPQHPCYNAAAYQQYYAQYYGTHQIQQQQAWQQGQYTQYHLQQTWPNGQYSQQYQAPQVSSVPPQVFKHVSQHIIQQPIRQPLSTHNTTHPPSATSLNNQKAISCYNCGAHDHWGAACSQPTRSLMSYPSTPTTVIPAPNQHKGPVVTKFAVPPHVLAQMKARGVNRTTAAIPSIPPVQSQSPYAAHHLGWQHWQGHTYPQGIPDYTQGQIQALIYTGNQNTNILAPQMSATSQTPVLPVGPQYEALLTPSSMNKSQDESTLTIHMELQGAAKDAGHNESSPVEDDDEEEDLALLDVPDIPKSYGTSGYNEPKLVAKPVYSVAPEWTSSGFGEVTLSEDPEGRTESDYIRLNTADSSINATRTPMQDMDPIFAIIDLDAPATTSKTRSGSKDSGKSELETPHSYGSGDTRPTSIDDLNDYSENAGGRRSRSITPFRRLDYEDIRQRHYHQSNPRRKRRRDRRGRDRDWRSQAQLQEKKRKRDDAEDQNDPQPILNGPLIKKHQPSTTSTTDLESGNPPTDPNL